MLLGSGSVHVGGRISGNSDALLKWTDVIGLGKCVVKIVKIWQMFSGQLSRRGLARSLWYIMLLWSLLGMPSVSTFRVRSQSASAPVPSSPTSASQAGQLYLRELRGLEAADGSTSGLVALDSPAAKKVVWVPLNPNRNRQNHILIPTFGWLLGQM